MHYIRLCIYLYYCRLPFKYFNPIASLKSRDFVQVHNDTLSFHCISPSRFTFFSFTSNFTSRKTINCRITKLRKCFNIPIFFIISLRYGFCVYNVFYFKIKPKIVPTDFEYIFCFIFIYKITINDIILVYFNGLISTGLK